MIAELLVRPEALVLKFEHLRVVVNGQRAVVFHGDDPVVAQFARKLGMEVRATETRASNAPGMVDVDESLELSVLECTLAAVAENFEHRFSLLDTLVRQLLRSVATQSHDEVAQRLVPVKRSIAALHTALIEYKSALSEVVSEPRALRGLYLNADK